MFGILTIALGECRYAEMAKMLALSLIQTNPSIKRAIVSDRREDEFKGLYDIYIPYNVNFGTGLSQKLYLDKYSPFERTLFIDSDCLVFKALDKTIELCSNYSFVVYGDPIRSGEWYMDVAQICKMFCLESIPLFNGGTYYFTKSALVHDIYKKARELSANYFALGFKEFRGSINEEPLISVAMALNKVEAIDDKGIGMRTPIGINGPLKVDVLNGKCAFVKEGEYVEPAIVHFSGGHAQAFHYKRETAKLKIMYAFPVLNKRIISLIVKLTYNVPYGLLVFFKRFIKTFSRNEKFDFRNALPVFSSQ